MEDRFIIVPDNELPSITDAPQTNSNNDEVDNSTDLPESTALSTNYSEEEVSEEVEPSIESLNRTMQDFLETMNEREVNSSSDLSIHAGHEGVQAITNALGGELINATLTEPYSVEDFFESIDDAVEMSTLSQPIIESIHQEIPPNSGSILVEESTSRFSGAIWFEAIKQKNIILAGLGGIGRLGNLNYFSYICT